MYEAVCGFGANLYRFSSKQKIYFFLSEFSLMVILRIIEVNISPQMSPAPQPRVMHAFFYFYMLQGRCEIISHNRDQYFRQRILFFCGGYKESENFLKATFGLL